MRFQCAELHEETVLGTHMILSLSIGPRTLLSDCNHSETAIFGGQQYVPPLRISTSTSALCTGPDDLLFDTQYPGTKFQGL